MFRYPIEQEITYSNNMEYRDCIRRVFEMDSNRWKNLDIDEETLDEFDYDQEIMRVFLNNLYDITITNDIIKELYKDAAALMISEDVNIGIAVLFSYDYFCYFHKVLYDYFQSQTEFHENIESVKILKEKLHR